jgi:hypothetical protein
MTGNHIDADPEETIELSFPADADFVALARFTASAVAARAGFDVEEIADLRLAVDELCASVGPYGMDACVRTVFQRRGDVVRVQCVFEVAASMARNGRSASAASWEPGELSQQLLGALVDQYGFDERNGFPCGWLEKRRGLVTQ